MQLQTGWFPKLGFEVNSPTHSLLVFVKAMHGDADADLALDVIAGKFTEKSKVTRSAGVLLRNGYIITTRDNKWAITAEGNNALITATARIPIRRKGSKRPYNKKGGY